MGQVFSRVAVSAAGKATNNRGSERRMTSLDRPLHSIAERLHALVGNSNITQNQVRLITGYFTRGNAIPIDMVKEQIEKELIEPLNHLRVALIVVDVQNDFITGSLSVKCGSAGEDPEAILPKIQQLLDEPKFSAVVVTQDWHPENHISFFSRVYDQDRELVGDDKNRPLSMFDEVSFVSPPVTQTLYPDHCVRGTEGAEIHPSLHLPDSTLILKKGEAIDHECYSAFRSESTNLHDKLREQGIDAVVVCGVATDICVAATARDAVSLGYLCAVVDDACAGLSKEAILSMQKELQEQNVVFMNTTEVEELLGGHLPFDWIRERTLQVIRRPCSA